MKRLLLLTMVSMGLFGFMFGQVTVLDFETPATSTTFQYFNNGFLSDSVVGSVPNPDMSGINMSANVGRFVRTAAATEFAGFFSNPNPSNLIDLTGASATDPITMKVWYPAATPTGNFLFKLEQSTTGSADWEVNVAVTPNEQWVEVTIDPTQASVNGNGAVAAGNVFQRLVLFFDVQTIGASDSTVYFFDDLVIPSPPSANVTLEVDMSEYAGAFTDVGVATSFNGFDPANTLTDAGNGIWSGTFNVAGGFDYYFVVDGTTNEEFDATDECVVDDGNGTFIRTFTLTGNSDSTLQSCWGSCYACADGVDITFELGFDNSITVDPNNVYVAGGAAFVAPGAANPYRMTDDDGDGLYTLTIERRTGFSSFFTFANGDCPDYSCKENISGQSCGDPGNFDDRNVLINNPATADVTIEACFGNCDAASCRSTNIDKELISNGLFYAVNNVFDEQFQVIFTEGLAQEKEVSIVNLAGATVYRSTVTRNQATLNIPTSEFAKGLYIMTVKTNDAIATQKLMK